MSNYHSCGSPCAVHSKPKSSQNPHPKGRSTVYTLAPKVPAQGFWVHLGTWALRGQIPNMNLALPSTRAVSRGARFRLRETLGLKV